MDVACWLSKTDELSEDFSVSRSINRLIKMAKEKYTEVVNHLALQNEFIENHHISETN